MKSLLAAAAALALALPVAAAADPAGDAVARYVAWRGGPAFQNATGLHVRGVIDNGRFNGPLERRIEPGRFAERLVLGSADIRRAVVGDEGWTVTLSGQVEDAGEGVAQEAARRRLTAFDDALDGRHGELTLEPDETFDGRSVQVLRVTFTPDSRYDLLLEPTTGALVADRTLEEGSSP